MTLHSHTMSFVTNLNQNLRVLCAEGRLKDAVNIAFTTNNPPVQASTYIHLLQSCIDKKALSEGKKISIHINDSKHAFATHPVIQTKLINMFDKCGSVVDARHIFDKINEPDVFSWNVIIAAYRNHGFPQQALKLFHQMQRSAVQPDHFTLSTVLPVCANTSSLKHGLQIHGKVIRCGFQSEVIVTNTLIDMYSKCGRIQNARQLFDNMQNADVVSWNAMIAGYTKQGFLDEAFMLFNEIPQPNAVSWTSIIAGYAQNGFVEKALNVFKEMQLAGVKPSSETFSSILPACAKTGIVEQGMGIHQKVTESGLPFNIVVANALIDMYSKCGSVRKARQLFDEMLHRNVISWTTMIVGYTQNGLADKALEMFNRMQVSGIKPNSSTFASILTSCAKMGDLEQGMEVHSKIIESGHLWDVVLVTALLDMYTKCGNIEKGHKLFNTMHNPDVVSWNTLITGYANIGVLDKALKLFNETPHRNAVSWTAVIAGFAQNGVVENALEYFKQMLLEGVEPSSVTFASILPALAKVGALEQGMEIHEKVIDRGLLSEVFVANTLLHMYAKCGNIKKAYKLFGKMPQRTIISWNAMIAGYAMHGYSNDALELFALMKHSETNPNHVSFVCVLFACSHAGSVDEGCKHFNNISDLYSIVPTTDHYVCMADLLGRACCLEETLNFIIKMPIKPDVVVWMCLLSACRLHVNVDLGEFVARTLFEIDSTNAAPYVLLSNIYAKVDRWGDHQKIRKIMQEEEIKKTPGCSWIEVSKDVHAFCAGDKSHPQTQEIYAKLDTLSWEMKVAGYTPNITPILNDVEEEEKEILLYHHSEKLAIAFGLLNTLPGTTIRVVKNLRVCGDCHTATKFISKIVAREIVVRDANRFHHFKHGQCSCGDYW